MLVEGLLSGLQPPKCPEEVQKYGVFGKRRIQDLRPNYYSSCDPLMIIDDPVVFDPTKPFSYPFSAYWSDYERPVGAVWTVPDKINQAWQESMDQMKNFQTARDRWLQEQSQNAIKEIDRIMADTKSEETTQPKNVRAVYEVEFDFIQKAYDQVACPRWKKILQEKFPLAIEVRHPCGSTFEDEDRNNYTLVAISETEGILVNLESGGEWYGVAYSFTKRVPLKRAHNDHTAGKYYATDADMKKVFGEEFKRVNENEF